MRSKADETLVIVKKQRNFAFDDEKVANNSIDYRFLINISNPE